MDGIFLSLLHGLYGDGYTTPSYINRDCRALGFRWMPSRNSSRVRLSASSYHSAQPRCATMACIPFP